MTDQNPYSPPNSKVESSASWHSTLTVIIVANALALLVVIWGLTEVVRNGSKSPIFVCLSALPVALSLASILFPRFRSITGLAILLGFLFSGLYLLALIAALIQAGLDFPLALIYPAFLSLALGVGAIALMRRRTGNSDKPTSDQGELT